MYRDILICQEEIMKRAIPVGGRPKRDRASGKNQVVTATFAIPADLYDRLKDCALVVGKPEEEVCREALLAYLAKVRGSR